MRAPHGLDRASIDYIRQQEANRLNRPTPLRNQTLVTPVQSAKTSGAKSGTAGRTVSANPKGTPTQQKAVLSARREHALGLDGPPRSRQELGLPSSGAKVGNKSAGAKTAAAGSPKSPKSPGGFKFGVKVTPPPEKQLPAIEGIDILRDEAVEQNTPASSLEQPLDTVRAADWHQLDASVSMPPPAKPKPAKAK
jgi:hypothetical protein